MYGANTLEAAAVVKMTRTLAILPITLVLALLRTRKERTGLCGSRFGRSFPISFYIFLRLR